MTRECKARCAAVVPDRRRAASAALHRSTSSEPPPARTLQQRLGNGATQALIARLQRKPNVTASDDPLERQADVVADRVMRMADPPGAVRHACEPPRIHRTPSADPGAGIDVGAAIQATRRSGSALPPDVRSFFEPRFGRDFGDVRVHTGNEAAHAARGTAARAYTIGSDIVFGAHEYAPGTAEGRRLLAHELAHVVQQESAGPKIRRRILIGGKIHVPSGAQYEEVKSKFGEDMIEFLLNMHNDGKRPDFRFDSYEQLRRELRIRAEAVRTMKGLSVDCCDYPRDGGTGKLDPAHWKKVDYFRFVLRTGRKPSEAIESIFRRGAGTELECGSMMMAIQYRALLTELGAEAFNRKFAGPELIIAPDMPALPFSKHPMGKKKMYRDVPITDEKDLLPGDWVYFDNWPDYGNRHPGGYWSGEHAMYLGDGKYRGFGTEEATKDGIEKELLKQYNDGLPRDKQKKWVPGFRHHARRPVISEIEKTRRR